MFVPHHRQYQNGKQLTKKACSIINCSLFRRRHRHARRVSPTYDDCPECRALAQQGFPTWCDCNECRAKRAAYPARVPYCDCEECRNTKRTF